MCYVGEHKNAVPIFSLRYYVTMQKDFEKIVSLQHRDCSTKLPLLKNLKKKKKQSLSLKYCM